MRGWQELARRLAAQNVARFAGGDAIRGIGLPALVFLYGEIADSRIDVLAKVGRERIRFNRMQRSDELCPGIRRRETRLKSRMQKRRVGTLDL